MGNRENRFRILDMQTLAYEGFTVGLTISFLEYKECLMILRELFTSRAINMLIELSNTNFNLYRLASYCNGM